MCVTSMLSHYHIFPRSHILCRPILSHHVHVMGNAHPRVHRVPTHEIPMPRLPMRTSCPELGVHVDQIRSEQSTSSRIGAAWPRIEFTSSSATTFAAHLPPPHPPSSIFLHSASFRVVLPCSVSPCPVTPRVILLPRLLFLTLCRP